MYAVTRKSFFEVLSSRIFYNESFHYRIAHFVFYILGVALLLTPSSTLAHYTNQDSRPPFSKSQKLQSNKLFMPNLVNPRASKVFLDFDGDGVTDRMDPDIDNDGIPNAADEYPYAATRFAKDQNQNGIPDFVDFYYHQDPHIQEFTNLQSRALSELGIWVVCDEICFTPDELSSIFELLFHPARSTQHKLKLIVIGKYKQKDALNFTRSSYDPYWQQISFFENQDHSDVMEFRTSFLHEMGHVLAESFPQTLHSFKTHFEAPLWPRLAPSPYSRQNLHEAFAESYALTAALEMPYSVSFDRFNNKQGFHLSKAYLLLSDIFKSYF